ncbi:MAG: OadG family protein [Eubacteriales bacterium]|nr:OadG family protein [Eubacteriales bacterium]
MLDRLLYGLKICAIGMTVVFLVLFILFIVLYCFKLYYNAGQKKISSAKDIPVDNVPVSSAAPDDEETVAILATAAISASRNDKEAAFKVISIKKIK